MSAAGSIGVPGPVLVTGAGGFVGRHLMRELGMGEGDFATDVTADFEAPEGVRRMAWNLPAGAPPELGEVRSIVHLAAMSSVAQSLREVQQVYAVNLLGTVSVLEYMLSRCPSARLLLVSSAEVYGPCDGRITEEDRIGPRNPYGASKAAAEIAALQYARSHDLDVRISRAFPHFGPGQSAGFALPSFCRRILTSRGSGERVIRVGNLRPVRDYLYVTDTVRAYAHILANGGPGDVFNVCTGLGSSMEEMVRMLIAISGADLDLRVDPGLFRPSDVEIQVGDPSKVTALLGWSPLIGREEGLRMLFRWWEERP